MPEPPASPVHRWRMAAALAAVAAFLLLYRLGAKDFWEASEARPAQSAREMRLQGDRLVPYTNGTVDLTKPPVYAWLVGASFALFGEIEWAARLPNVLVTLLVLALTAHLAARIGGARAGTLAAFLLFTQARFLWQARLAELEMLLCLAVVSAHASLARLLEAQDRRGRFGWAAATFASIGFGFAVKGPIALLLVVPAAIGGALWVGRGRTLVAPAVLAALPLAAIVGLPWYAAVVLRDRAHLDTFLAYARGENVGHVRDAFYYLVQWPLAALPWTPLVVLGCRRPPAGSPRTPAMRTSLATAAFAIPFLVLTALPPKQTHYLVPLLPFGAVVAATWLDRRLDAWLSRAGLRRAIVGALVAVVAIEAVAAGHVLPALDERMSAREFFEGVARRTKDGPLAWTVFGSHSDYLWYLGPERVGTAGVPELVGRDDAETVERVRAFLAGPGPRYAVVTGAQADALSAHAAVLLRDDDVQKKHRRLALVGGGEGSSP